MALYLPDVEFHRPADLKTASQILRKFGKDAKILAGGTDLLVELKQNLRSVKHIVSLENIKILQKISKTKKQILIGSLCNLNQIAEDKIIKKELPALSDTAAMMCSNPVRNVATIGGNIASAVPSADLPPILIAMEAKVKITSTQNSRIINLEDFFTGPRRNILKYGEIITQIIVPIQPSKSGSSYQRFTLREANALAVAGVAARIILAQEKIKSARIVLGAVAPTPLMAIRAQKFLIGKEPSEENFLQAGKIASEESKPISDVRGTIDFRKELVKILTKSALMNAAKNISNS